MGCSAPRAIVLHGPRFWANSVTPRAQVWWAVVRRLVDRMAATTSRPGMPPPRQERLELPRALKQDQAARGAGRSQARSGRTRRWGESDRSSCTAPIRTWIAA